MKPQIDDSNRRLTNKEPQNWEVQRDLCQHSVLLTSPVRIVNLRFLVRQSNSGCPGSDRAPHRCLAELTNARVVAYEGAENRSHSNSARVGCQSHEPWTLGNGPVGIHLGNARRLR